MAFGVSGLGIILLAAGAILTYKRSWSTYENLDEEHEHINDPNDSLNSSS